jgi:drug/metabolite transporter (DMT)-like permease
MLAGSIMLAIVSLSLSETWSLPTTWEKNVQWSMLGLIFFGSIIAFTAFNYLLKVVSPEKVATSTYVNPIIALILGWWVLNEQITTQSIIAAIILLTGVYFINSTRQFKIRAHGR